MRIFGRPPGWVVVLAATPLLSGLYLLLPTEGLARTIAYPSLGLIGAAVIAIGVHRRHPTRPNSWRLIALAFATFAIGDVAYSVLSLAGEVAFPSLSDIAYLSGYAMLVLGIVGLVGGRVAGGDRTPLIDASILAAGAASIFWVGIIKPGLEGVADPLAATVSLAYPAFDLILLALCARVVLGGEGRPRYLQLLLVGIGLYFATDVYYANEILHASYVYGSPVDAGWIAGVLMVGAAALHPSVAQPLPAIEQSVSGLSRPRLILLGVAALLAPTILLVHGLRETDDTVIGLATVGIVLLGLVLVRLANTVSELATSLVQRRQLQGDLAHQAHHDPLTGLANRLLFNIRLAEAVAGAPDSTAVIFLDLDDFKAINDTFGHPTGDRVLGILGGRLQRGLRGNDLAARIGGDEFAILVEDCTVPERALTVAERAMSMLRAPITVGGRQLVLHASAGVAIGRRDLTGTDLMRDADIAMYQAKAHGKDQVELFAESMRGKVLQAYDAILHPEPAAPTPRSARVKAKPKVPRAA